MKTLMRSALAILAVVLLAVSVQSQAGPPANNSEFREVADTLTVDSQHSVVWEYIDSMIIAITDTCYTVYTVSGTAILDPGNVLYIGIKDGAGDPAAAADDTLIVRAGTTWPGKSYIPFSFIYLDSSITQSDVADTIYVTAAVGGSTAYERVMIDNLYFTGQVIDID